MSPAIKRRKLEELAIGFNDFTPAAMKSWMEVLDFTALKNLSLRGLSSERLIGVLCNSIRANEECQITEIDLSHCNLTDSCIDQFVITFDHIPNMKKLVLKNNVQFSIDVLANLLSNFRLKNVHIQELDLLGCALNRSNTSDNGSCVDNLRAFLSWSKSLRHLSLSFSRQKSDSTWIPSLTDIWIMSHGREVIAKQPTEHQLILTTSSS